ncbi:hypothetical protein BJX70DRAFT_360328 [Aspergillus crustosus]
MANATVSVTEADLEALQGGDGDRSATQPLLGLETPRERGRGRGREYDGYTGVVGDDHPLRSSLSKAAVRRYNAILKTRGLPVLCMVLMILIVVQFLVQLPRVATYFFEPVSMKDIPGFIQTSEMTGQSAEYAQDCVYNPLSQTGGAARDAVEDALVSGCTWVKVGVWVRDRTLLVASSRDSLEQEHTLQSVYLRPLRDQLDVRKFSHNNSAGTGDGLDSEELLPVGLFEDDLRQSFTLFLEIRTPMRMAWPLLVAQLRELNQRGYLSYRDMEQVL